MTVLPDWLYLKRSSLDTAIEFAGVTWSYRDLYGIAGELAGRLRVEWGVTAGDRVALLARDGLVFAAALHALMQMNAVVVPLNTRLTASEIAWQLRDAGVRVVLTDANYNGLAVQASALTKVVSSLTEVASSPQAVLLQGEFWQSMASPVIRKSVDLDEVHAIVYTSGTTGFPKGALITYGNHLWGAYGSALRLGIVASDRWLIPMPLFHVGGLAVLMRSLIYGTAVEIHDQFDEYRVCASLQHHGVTLLSVVAVMLQRLLALDLKRFPPSVRAVLLGGGSAPRALLDECVRLQVPVQFSYGLTESNAQAATLSLADSLRKIGSAGQPLFMNQIKIVANGHEQLPMQPGEILIKGPTVVKGYYGRTEVTRKAIQDGWLYTGDIGYMDDDGYLYVLDRRSDLIVSGGENVYPAEIEAVLHAHEAILEAGVAGTLDAEFGQVPFAVVRLKPGVELTEDELRAYLSMRLAKYKVPRQIRFADELPRNAAGKLLRRELVKWL